MLFLVVLSVLSSIPVCVCVCVWLSLLAQYLTNHLWEFHQNYNYDAFGDKDELIRFWGQKGQWSRSQRDIHDTEIRISD